jgi:hypothetical protein
VVQQELVGESPPTCRRPVDAGSLAKLQNPTVQRASVGRREKNHGPWKQRPIDGMKEGHSQHFHAEVISTPSTQVDKRCRREKKKKQIMPHGTQRPNV